MKKGCCVEKKWLVWQSISLWLLPVLIPYPPLPPTKKTKTNCYYPSWQIPLSLAVLVSHKGRSFAFSQVLNYLLLLHMKVTRILVMTHIKKKKHYFFGSEKCSCANQTTFQTLMDLPPSSTCSLVRCLVLTRSRAHSEFLLGFFLLFSFFSVSVERVQA